MSNALCGILPILYVSFISVVCYIVVSFLSLFFFVIDSKMREIEEGILSYLVGFPNSHRFLFCIYPCGMVCY